MKALALSQPWAELVVSGRKTTEVRTRNCNYRGWLYIYAAKKDTKLVVVNEFGFGVLPTGVIVGRVFLRDVKAYLDNETFFQDARNHLVTRDVLELEGWENRTKYGYLLEQPSRIPPFACRGLPGLFDVLPYNRHASEIVGPEINKDW
jgi:hypothetical protein